MKDSVLTCYYSTIMIRRGTFLCPSLVTNAIVLVESLRLEMYASVTDYLLHNSALNRDKRRYNDDKINVPQ